MKRNRIVGTMLMLMLCVGACVQAELSATEQAASFEHAADAVSNSPATYLEATLEPCVPMQNVSFDPCSQEPYAGDHQHAFAQLVLPETPETIIERMKARKHYSEATQFVVRGVLVPDTMRCNWSQLLISSSSVVYEPRREFDSLMCVADFRVSEYMVGKGPPTLSVIMFVQYGIELGEISIDTDGIPMVDGKKYVESNYSTLTYGTELILWLVLPFNVLFQAWNYIDVWYLDREDGNVNVVHNTKEYYELTPANLALLEYTLDDYRREVKKAHSDFVSSMSASIASGQSTTFVNDANDEFLRAKLVELGADDHSGIMITSPPPTSEGGLHTLTPIPADTPTPTPEPAATPTPTPTPTATPTPTPTSVPGGVTVTAQRSADGTSVDVSWTKFTLSGFNYYRFVMCRAADYVGGTCSNNVYNGDPIYSIDNLGPVTVTGLDASESYGLIMQVWYDASSSVHKYHATVPAGE